MENLFRKEKGITLIALIITVILMLILAGVAISAITDGNGLFSKTRTGVELYSNATKEENTTITNLMNYIDRYMNNNENSGSDMEEGKDTAPPTIATLEVIEDSITQTTFTLKATGADATATNTSGASGIAKYEFYIKNSDGTFKLEKQ